MAPRRGLTSIVTSHTNQIMRKYVEMGEKRMPIAMVFGCHPAYEIMANFSGLHMDMWGELEMVGTIMDQDIEMVPAETLDLNVPAHAEMIVEGHVNLTERFPVGAVTAPSMYRMPQAENVPEMHVTAITMREDRPIYRNHQTCPQTDHQSLPRLCHEAVLYNRLTEIGLNVKEVRFPLWGAALSVIIQVEYPWDGFVNDALMTCMGAPWLNTKLVVAVSPDTDIESAESVYTAIATRADPSRDIITVPHTRGSLYDPVRGTVDGPLPLQDRRQDGYRRDDQVAPQPQGLRVRGAEELGQGLHRRLSLSRRTTMSTDGQTAMPLEASPFIPYADPASAPVYMQEALEKYEERMGFVPNALRFYLHRPEIASVLWDLNNKVMRDPSSTLDLQLKRRLGAYASRTNGCKYCTTHHCEILQSPSGFGAEGWDMDDEELARLLNGEPDPANAFEAACFEFVRQASADPTSVPDETLETLREHLSPEQIVELAAVVGFWKMYNTIHDALHIPIESRLLARSETVGIE